MRPRFAQCFAVVSLAVALHAQEQKPFTPRVADGFSTDWDHLTMEQKELAPGLTFMHASGGNTVVLTGKDGTLVVDPAYAQVAPLLKRTLEGMHAYPVKFVVGTHFHADHSSGNAALVADGATVIAQTQYREKMMHPQVSAMTGKASPPAPEGNWPTITYSKSMDVYFDGEDVELEFYQPSHTDGDTIVYFKKANVVHLGDVFVNNLYPFIDLSAPDRVDGYFPVIDAVLARIDDKTAVIAGHGPIANKAQLKAYRDMIKTVRDRVAAQVAAGKTLEQIQAMHLAAEFDAQYATDRIDGVRFVANIYTSLTGKKQ